MKAQRQLTCEERIDEHLKNWIAEFKEALDKANGDYEWTEDEEDERESFDIIDWLNNNALSYNDDTYYRAKRLELSWGGPADGFIFFENGDIVYYFQDWFDGAKRELTGKDYDTMREFYDYALNI